MRVKSINYTNFSRKKNSCNVFQKKKKRRTKTVTVRVNALLQQWSMAPLFCFSTLQNAASPKPVARLRIGWVPPLKICFLLLTKRYLVWRYQTD